VVDFAGTITLFAFIDPCLSYVSDGDAKLRAVISGMAGSRLPDTVFAQVLMVPGAQLIVWIARIIPS